MAHNRAADPLAFEQAMALARRRTGQPGGIGTLRERTLHAVLKYYFEPDSENHEIRVGGYVADIVGADGIIEIQTRGLNLLRPKLAAFLECARVTVVYPVAAVKWLCWIDPDTGAAVSRRKSPRRGIPQDAFAELYKIRPFLKHPNLTVCLVLLALEEYRRPGGNSRDKRRGSVRQERLPVALLDQLMLDTPDSYAQLIPHRLPAPFTSADYAAAVSRSRPYASQALQILTDVGAVRRVGRQAGGYLYQTRA